MINRSEFKWYQEEADWLLAKYPRVVFHWPRQSGKTLIGTYLLKEYALNNPGSLCVGLFLGAALAHFDTNLLVKLFKDQPQLIKARGKEFVELVNGSEIRFSSAYQFEKTQIFNLDFIFLDEYLVFQPVFFSEFLPLLGKRTKLVASGTPTGRTQNVLKLFPDVRPFVSHVTDTEKLVK